MPIVIKDCNWKQTEDKVCIQVPLRGSAPNKVDIFTSSQYIKASFAAFFFEAFLLEPIDISQSKCTKTPEYILFDLKKSTDKIWESLEIENMPKDEKKMLKQKLIEEEHKRLHRESEEKVSKKAELKRIAINEQIQLDTKVRNKIEEIKKFEENKALGDLNDWKRSVDAQKLNYNKLDNDNDEKFIDVTKRIYPTGVKKNELRTPRCKSVSTHKTPRTTSVPKPRNIRSLQIIFTPREFPTPSRESRLQEENEFLSKQAEARRTVGFVDEDLRPEEKNPQYLLAKGNEFLKNENYLGAISAFTFGIKLSPKFVDLYLARSEVHILANNFKRAVEDCTSALNLLNPPLPVNLHNRAICLGRRGIALYNLGFLKHGISELEASIKLEQSAQFESMLKKYQLEYAELDRKKTVNINIDDKKRI